MSAREELALSKRRSHLVELVRRRMDCENPKRRVVRLLRALSVLFLLFFGFWDMNPLVAEAIYAVTAFFLLVEEFVRLRHRAPRRRWKEMMYEAGVGGLCLFIFPALVLLGEECTTEVVVVMSFMLMFGLVSMLLFFYALHRYLRLKHEIEEEKEAIRYRLRRQKKLELL